MAISEAGKEGGAGGGSEGYEAGEGEGEELEEDLDLDSYINELSAEVEVGARASPWFLPLPAGALSGVPPAGSSPWLLPWRA